jgi:hypothetical protein
VPHPKLVMFGIGIVLAISENDFDLKILLILDHEDGSYNNFTVVNTIKILYMRLSYTASKEWYHRALLAISSNSVSFVF